MITSQILVSKNMSAHRDIHCAIRCGDIEATRRYIDMNTNIESIEYPTLHDNIDQYKPLHLAALSDNLEIAELLIKNGANINSYDRWERTPLDIAATHKSVRVARLLIKNGANIDIAISDALHRAAYQGCMELVELLIESGADVNARNGNDATPLFMVSRYNCEDIARLLIVKGAHVNIENCWGQTPLHIAAEYDSAVIVTILIESRANIEAKDNNGSTPLHVVPNVQGDVAAILLQYGANVNVLDNVGISPLIRTVLSLCKESMTIKGKLTILANAPNIDADTVHKAIEIADRHGKKYIVDILEEASAKRYSNIKSAKCEVRKKINYD